MQDDSIVDPFDTLNDMTRTGSLVTLVTGQIEKLIWEGRLRAGDQLPPERELCRQFGVSRTVVREAVARLSAKNLLEVRSGTGGGIVVRAPSAGHVSDSLKMLLRTGSGTLNHEKVLEVRRLLEVEIARLAAARRTDADVAKLERILATSAASTADRDRFAESDVEFHTALAAATQNELFVVLLDSMAEIMLSVRRFGFDTPGMTGRALWHHRAILDQVRQSNVTGAARAMSDHLVEAEETVRTALLRKADKHGER